MLQIRLSLKKHCKVFKAFHIEYCFVTFCPFTNYQDYFIITFEFFIYMFFLRECILGWIVIAHFQQ